MTVKKGDKVKVDYTGKFKDGTIFDSSKHGDHSHPLEFEVGASKVIKGFDDALIGMKLNEEKEFTILPEEGYGQPNPQMFQSIPKSQLPKEEEPKIGMVLMMHLPNGAQLPAKIVEIKENEVKLDLNHPLAGKTLVFNIKLLEIMNS